VVVVAGYYRRILSLVNKPKPLKKPVKPVAPVKPVKPISQPRKRPQYRKRRG
jgi:hypothetical protein